MDKSTALRAIESKKQLVAKPPRVATIKTSAEGFAELLRRVSEAPTREIEKLINELQSLRTELQNAGNRIQRDIAQYTELSQQSMQLTAIISDSVKKLPDGTRQAHQVLRNRSGSLI